MLCLIANGAAGAFGAIGLPVSIIDTFNLSGGVTTLDVEILSINTSNFKLYYSICFSIHCRWYERY